MRGNPPSGVDGTRPTGADCFGSDGVYERIHAPTDGNDPAAADSDRSTVC